MAADRSGQALLAVIRSDNMRHQQSDSMDEQCWFPAEGKDMTGECASSGFRLPLGVAVSRMTIDTGTCEESWDDPRGLGFGV
jgi:hypothetical protein